jgi:hypothetical protein
MPRTRPTQQDCHVLAKRIFANHPIAAPDGRLPGILFQQELTPKFLPALRLGPVVGSEKVRLEPPARPCCPECGGCRWVRRALRLPGSACGNTS